MSFAVRQVYLDENHSEVRFRKFNDIETDVQEVMRRGWFGYLGALQELIEGRVVGVYESVPQIAGGAS